MPIQTEAAPQKPQLIRVEKAVAKFIDNLDAQGVPYTDARDNPQVAVTFNHGNEESTKFFIGGYQGPLFATFMEGRILVEQAITAFEYVRPRAKKSGRMYNQLLAVEANGERVEQRDYAKYAQQETGDEGDDYTRASPSALATGAAPKAAAPAKERDRTWNEKERIIVRQGCSNIAMGLMGLEGPGGSFGSRDETLAGMLGLQQALERWVLAAGNMEPNAVAFPWDSLGYPDDPTKQAEAEAPAGDELEVLTPVTQREIIELYCKISAVQGIAQSELLAGMGLKWLNREGTVEWGNFTEVDGQVLLLHLRTPQGRAAFGRFMAKGAIGSQEEGD